MGKLDGKIALITGGNGGIGLATAKAFVNEGAYVFITGRRNAELAAAVKEIGSTVTGVQGDVSSLSDLDRLFAQIMREKGRLDILFANAGVAKYAPLGTITEEFFDSIFDVNVKGLLFTVQKALPLMPEGGAIILNASIAGSKGFSANSVYSATKAAVRSFARTRWAGSVQPMRSRRPWSSWRPMTAATSRERNCLWTAAWHKCRPPSASSGQWNLARRSNPRSASRRQFSNC